MADNSSQLTGKRRLFLKSLGALGVSAAVGPTAAAQSSSSDLGAYRQTLRAELTASSRQQKQLPAGTYVYGETEETATDVFTPRGGATTGTVAVDTDAVPITTGERLMVSAGTEDPSAIAYSGAVTDHEFSEGDRLLGVAYVRSDDDDAEAHAAFGYRAADAAGNDPVAENFVQRGAEIDPTGEWMRYFFPIEVGAKPSSDAVPTLEFWAGYGAQSIEFGGVALFDYSDSDVSLGTLPPYDYEGRDEDAEWRAAAHERIEEIRKTDMEVEVLNPGGQPMNDATVEVEMAEHAFDFGSAVSVEHITGDSEDDERYREIFQENFNKATIENGLKFPAWEGDWDIDNDATQATLDWLNERDFPVRGHHLLWEQANPDGGGGMSLEKDLSEYTAAEVDELVSEKIRSHAVEFEDDVAEWDMHNHPIWQSNFRDKDGLGWDAVDKWWDIADENSDHELHTNEMGVVGGAWQRSQYYDYITHLVENDYPLDGIGFMAHHQQQWNQMLDIENMIAGFDDFSEFGVPLIITEFDIEIFSRRNAQDVAVQRDYLRDFLTVAFSKPAVEALVSWGFWEDDHWRPTGAYYDSDWTLREHGEKFLDLVYDEWWTEETGETDDDGVYATRGFKGEYEVSAEKGALSGETTVTVDDDTDTVTVELETPGNGNGNGNGNGKGNGKGNGN
jgi:GH35 family endo-1,4-beta-xylanase